MTLLRHTLTTLALSASLLGVACSAQDQAGSESANNTDAAPLDIMEKGPESPSRWDVSRTPEGGWLFRLEALHGEMLLTSDTAYAEKESAYAGINAVEEYGVLLSNYVVVEHSPNNFSFRVIAGGSAQNPVGNNMPLADGPQFRTFEAAEAAIPAARDMVAAFVQYRAAKTNGARFEMWRDWDPNNEYEDGMWFFVMRGEDGNVLLESQAYEGRGGATNGILSVRDNGRLFDRYSAKDHDVDGDGVSDGIRLHLRAGNNWEIANAPELFPSVEAAMEYAAGTQVLIESERVASPW